MVQLNPAWSVNDVVDAIVSGTFRIPNIQRGFEWDQSRIINLLDSIMKGYPIGAIMVWSPDSDVRSEIPTRRFSQHYDASHDYLALSPEPQDTGSYLVLDGQQRLQSLYIALQGSYNRQRIFFQLDHIPSPADEDPDYRFMFLHPDNARIPGSVVELHWIINLHPQQKFAFIDRIAEELVNSIEDDQERSEAYRQKRLMINQNVDALIYRFALTKAVLIQQVEHQQDYDQVLEIFERVNSGGMVLDKSDLIFSTLKLKLSEMEHKFVDTINHLNHGNRYSFNTDFLIKTSLVVFDQQAKYEVRKLRNDSFIQALSSRFDELSHCLRQAVAWLDDDARIRCNRFLRSRNALIPVIDYMMQSGERDKPEGSNSQTMKEYLYMAFFRRVFTRGADTVLDQLHRIIRASVRRDPSRFPIEEIRQYMVNRQNQSWVLEDHYFNDDPDLMLNIVDGGVLQVDRNDRSKHPTDLLLEVDHIFPRKILGDRGLHAIRDDLGNYRLIVRQKNRRKSAKMPNDRTGFYGRQHKVIEPLYREAVRNLSEETFREFRDTRKQLIKRHVQDFLQVPMAAEDHDVFTVPDFPEGTDPPSIEPESLTPPGSDQTDLTGSIEETPDTVRQILNRRGGSSNGQKAVYRVLYEVGESGISYSDLAKRINRTEAQLNGVLGALGVRVNGTNGVTGTPGIGLLVYIYRNTPGGEWNYRLRPELREILEEPEFQHIVGSTD